METVDRNSICRLCLLGGDDLSSIFEANVVNGLIVADLIKDLLQFQVSVNDGYPHLVCRICLSKLNEFLHFKRQCQTSRITYDNVFSPCEKASDFSIPVKVFGRNLGRERNVGIMVVSCCAWNCNKKFVKGSGITFHSFPVNEERRKLWTLSLRRKDFVPSIYSKICSKHFAEECYDREKFGGHWLKPTAVPTIYDFPKHLLPKEIRRSSPKKRSIEEEGSSNTVSTTTTVEPGKTHSYNNDSPPYMDETNSCVVSRSHSTPKRSGKKYWYIGDFTEEDMKSPSKARKVLQLATDNCQKNRQLMRRLHSKSQWLERKVTSLQQIVDELKKNSLVSESAADVLMFGVIKSENEEITINEEQLNYESEGSERTTAYADDASNQMEMIAVKDEPLDSSCDEEQIKSSYGPIHKVQTSFGEQQKVESDTVIKAEPEEQEDMPCESHTVIMAEPEDQEDMPYENSYNMENIEARFSPKKTTSRRNCCVPQCASIYFRNPDLRFHKFPKEGQVVLIANKWNIREKCDRRKMWIKLLKIGKPVTKNMFVCSRHFLKSDYFFPDVAVRHRFLKKTAVPSLNLPRTSVEARLLAKRNFDNCRRSRKKKEIAVSSYGPIHMVQTSFRGQQQVESDTVIKAEPEDQEDMPCESSYGPIQMVQTSFTGQQQVEFGVIKSENEEITISEEQLNYESEGSERTTAYADDASNQDEEAWSTRFVETTRGQRRLLHDGYAYLVDKRRGMLTHWRCEKRKGCSGRLKTVEDVVQGTPSHHNHPPDAARIIALRCINRIKQLAGETAEATSAIINSCTQDFPLSAVGSLPKKKTLRKMIQRKRTAIDSDISCHDNASRSEDSLHLNLLHGSCEEDKIKL